MFSIVLSFVVYGFIEFLGQFYRKDNYYIIFFIEGENEIRVYRVKNVEFRI